MSLCRHSSVNTHRDRSRLVTRTMPKKKKKKDKKEGKKKGKGGGAKGDELQKPYEPPGASEKEVTLRAEYVQLAS